MTINKQIENFLETNLKNWVAMSTEKKLWWIKMTKNSLDISADNSFALMSRITTTGEEAVFVLNGAN